MFLHLDRSDLKRYSCSVLSVFAAAVLTLAITPLFHGKAPLIFFTVGAVISAAYGGVGPGLLTTGLSVATVLAFFDPSILVLAAAHSSLILFAALGTGLSLILGHLRKANTALARAKERLDVANKALLERTDALSQANEELQRFAFALAHDLNTPLRGISALTELLIERNAEKLDESSTECGGLIVNKVKRMQALIKGLLEYAAATETPERKISLEQRILTDCNLVLEEAKLALDSVIRLSGAQITASPLPSVPATESQLVQVFSNLIGNAAKYCPGIRKPQIHISASEQVDNWIFCVSDNGIGLDMKYAEDIFGLFKRLHGEGQFEGSGIGLALCKTVIQRHGGRIWVESELGKGCRFFFTLPKGTDSQTLTQNHQGLAASPRAVFE
jgi:signal transduction histidine kinase